MIDLDKVLKEAWARPQLMGIVNATPDSFSDGGLHEATEDAVAAAQRMAAEGAIFIDIGGESTRPGAEEVGVDGEIDRIRPVFDALKENAPGILSIDTYKAATAEAAVQAGAQIVNDVWGLAREPDIARVAGSAGAGVVITYNRGEADETVDILADMRAFLGCQIEHALASGVAEHRIILDPGVGFGKTQAQNYAVLAGLETLADFRCLILVGVSRKSLIGKLTGAPVEARLPGTLAAGLVSVQKGAHILRVHDVAEHKQALDVCAAIEGTSQ